MVQPADTRHLKCLKVQVRVLLDGPVIVYNKQMAGYQGLQVPQEVKEKIKQTFRRKRIERYFKIERIWPGQTLKYALTEAGIKKDECEVCHIGQEWNGKKLILELDHINGNRVDNRIENLRIICPNCHSQTDTYKWKNSKTIKPYKVSITTRAHNSMVE